MIDFRSGNNPEVHLTQCGVILDWAEYAKESVDDIVKNIEQFHDLNRAEFQSLGPEFYAKNSTYIYDILSGNAAIEWRVNLINRFIPNGFGRMIEHAGTKFADFGGGIGLVCEIMKRASNKEVTYIDIPSRITDFAHWRFQKYELDVKSVIISEEDFTLPDTYDIIFTDAVWEHLPPEKQLRYLEKLTGYINHKGLFYFLVDLSGQSEEMPLHYNVDIVKLHQRLRQLGFMCLHGETGFASVWEKSIAFTQFDDE